NSEVFDHPFAGLTFELDVTAGRQEGKSSLRRADKMASADSSQSPQPEVQPKLAAIVGDEVEDRAHLLVVVATQAASDLLQEYGDRLCRPQKKDRVDLGNVDALVEHVSGEDGTELASCEASDLLVPNRLRRVTCHRN